MLGKDNLFYNYGQTFGPVKKREGELPHGTSPPANLKQPTKEIDNLCREGTLRFPSGVVRLPIFLSYK